MYLLAIPIGFTILTLLTFLVEPRRMIGGVFCLFALGSWVMILPALFPRSPAMLVALALFLLLPVFYLAITIYFFVCGYQTLKREGRSLANSLSLLFALLLVLWPFLLLLLMAVVGPQFSTKVLAVAITVMLFFVLSFGGFFCYSLLYCLVPRRVRCDYIVIHGAGLGKDGAVTPLLQRRIDKALRIYHRCGERPILVPSGGKGSDEQRSEAEAITSYLLEQGIPSKKILPEDRSTTTYENVKDTKALLDARCGRRRYRCILVTNNYHIMRAVIYARQLKLNAQGVGCRTAGYYLPGAFLREYVAVMKLSRVTLILLAIALVLELIFC